MASSGSIVYFSLASGEILRSSSIGRFEPFGDVSFPASVMTVGADGSVYIASSRDGSVCRIGAAGDASMLPSLPSPARSLLVDNNHVLWAVGSQSVSRFVSNKWTVLPAIAGLPSSRIESLLSCSGPEIWLATGRGIVALYVSESDVTISKSALASDESFLPNSAYCSDNDVLIFGAAKSVVLVSRTGAPALMPWSPEYDPDVIPSRRLFPVWLLSLVLVVLSFIAGWLLARRGGPGEISSPVSVPQPVSDPVQDPVIPAPVASRPERRVVHKSVSPKENPSSSGLSGLELIALLEHLEQEDHSPFAQQVISHIRDSFTNAEFSVEDIASSLALSRVHLNRKLQSELGVSPSVLIKTYRMRHAYGMLSQSTYTIAEIASESGFSSSSYFSSAFRDFFGFPPSEYPSQTA